MRATHLVYPISNPLLNQLAAWTPWSHSAPLLCRCKRRPSPSRVLCLPILSLEERMTDSGNAEHATYVPARIVLLSCVRRGTIYGRWRADPAVRQPLAGCVIGGTDRPGRMDGSQLGSLTKGLLNVTLELFERSITCFSRMT